MRFISWTTGKGLGAFWADNRRLSAIRYLETRLVTSLGKGAESVALLFGRSGDLWFWVEVGEAGSGASIPQEVFAGRKKTSPHTATRSG
jgi:hypothetical protein